jgi:hypothetical protein
MQFEEFQMMDYTLTAAKVLFRPPEPAPVPPPPPAAEKPAEEAQTPAE